MSQGDWEKLSAEQQEAVNMWRKRVGELIDAARKEFESAHPELRLNYSFTSEPLIRADHPVIFEDL